jgi:DNA invertase Pin-like site-specific DNA recombinase
MEQTRVVAYARVSSKEQAEKELSIPAQLKAIRKYCQNKNYKLVAEYLDEGKSAKTADRPAFQKMIALAKKQNRHFDAIIVHKFDRFSRSREDHVVYKALLRKVGVHVNSVTEQTDPETPHGFLLEGMLEVISEFYNMNLRNETLKGMTENAKRGFHNGGAVPYGYQPKQITDNRGNPKTVWEPHLEEAPIVQEIFEMYINRNMGYKAIANELNDRGIITRLGNKWGYTTIWHILHNEVYIGQRIWNKRDYVTNGVKRRPKKDWVITANAHEPLVSRDLFNAVKQRSTDRTNNADAVKKVSRVSPFILRGLLLCPDCGARMVTGSNSIKSRGYTRYYHCGTYQRKGPISCKRNPAPKDRLEIKVLEAFINELIQLLEPGVLEYELERYNEKVNKELLAQVAELEGGIKYIDKRINQLKESLQAGEDQSVQGLDEMAAEKGQMEKQLADLIQQQKRVDLASDESETLKFIIKDTSLRIFIEPPDIQWSLLKKFVQHIRLDKKTSNYKMSLVVRRLSEIDNISAPILLERTCYFANPFGDKSSTVDKASKRLPNR